MALQRSNHATAFASWTVTTIGLGLIFQARAVVTAGSTSVVLLLTGLILPVLAMTGRVIFLLVLARRAGAGTAVGGAWRGEHDPSTGAAADEPPSAQPTSPSSPAGQDEFGSGQALNRLRLLTVALARREALAHSALNWAYVAGGGFLVWSLLTTLLSAGD
jgi:hypothetical protein